MVRSYAELCVNITGLACSLRDLGIGADTLVSLMTERSTEMVLGIYGIMLSGGAYVPLDPKLPVSRLRLMLEDTTALVGKRALLT